MKNFYKKSLVTILAAFFLSAYLNVCFAATPTVNSYTPTINMPAISTYTATIPGKIQGVNQASSTSMTWIDHDDFAPNLAKTNTTVLRWPDGNFANMHDWKSELNNTSIFNLKNARDFTTTHSLTLQIVLNYGNTTAQEAADYVRFCNSGLDYWADEREDLLGDSDPLNVNVWEIGNEIGTAYGWAYNWFGHPYEDTVHFRTATTYSIYSQRWADSLYYYGGTAKREGWVTHNEEQSKWDNILGDKYWTTTSATSYQIEIKHPTIPTNESKIRVYYIPSTAITMGYIETNSTLATYTLITSPSYSLATSKYFINPNGMGVQVTPGGTISANSLIYIEYPSMGHAGAFEIRDAMIEADENIKIGYCVDFMKSLISSDDADETSNNFKDSLIASPPAFMIEHNYPTPVTRGLIETNRYTSLAHFPSNLKNVKYARTQSILDSITEELEISAIGIGITEWNVGLWGLAPDTFPFHGIAGAMYNASYRGHMLETLIDDSIHLEAMSQFACLSSDPNSFLHQFASDGINFAVKNTGYAARLFGEAIKGKFNLPSSITTNTLIVEGGYSFPTIEAWLSYDEATGNIGALVLNTHSVNATAVKIKFPSNPGYTWCAWKYLTGSNNVITNNLLDTTHAITSTTLTVTGNPPPAGKTPWTVYVTLPPYSINSFVFPGSGYSGKWDESENDGSNEEQGSILEEGPASGIGNSDQQEAFIFPNPAFDKLYIKATEKISSIKITNIFGAEVMHVLVQNNNDYTDISQISAGSYFIHINYKNGSREVKKFVKR